MYRLLKYQIFLLSKSKTLYLSVAFYFIYMFCIFLLPTTLSKYLTIKNLYFIRELDVLSINIIIFSIISAILVVLIFSTCIEDGSQIIIFSKPIKR